MNYLSLNFKDDFSVQGGDARRGVDPVTSSPGRDLPAFEDEEAPGGQFENEEEEEEGENLFGDDMLNDYRAMPGLDRLVNGKSKLLFFTSIIS